MADAGGRRFDDVRIDGGDVLLRAWRPGDLASLVRHANDAEVARGLSERFPHPYVEDDGRAFLAGTVVDLDDPVLAIIVDGEACGGIGVRLGHGERDHAAELGYWLARTHWGRGMMTRVVGLYLAWLVPACGLQRVQAFTLDFNQASARVLLKNGFEEEGRQRGAIRRDGRLHDLRLFGRMS